MTSPEARVRWGVLGAAAIAVGQVIPAIQRSKKCEVVAIASRDPKRERKWDGWND
jgi:predicted dehydrogenase